MQVRTKRFEILLSPEEEEIIQARMEKMGIQNMSAYLRKMALNGYCVRLDVPEINETLSLLRRCSNNMNQYAKRANENGSIYRTDIQDIKDKFDGIRDLMKQILSRLASIQ